MARHRQLTPDEESEFGNLMRKVQNGEICLFIGAGASLGSNAPSGNELVKQIKNKFNNIDFSDVGYNLLDICQEIDDCGERGDLERFVAKVFYGLKFNNAHRIIAKYGQLWPVIFTTNYDDLVENSLEDYYDSNKDKNPKMGVPIIDANYKFGVDKKDEINVYKLMGDSKRNTPEESPVLTRSDYSKRSNSRKKMLGILSNYIHDGSILYIGYSFKDKIIFELIDELTNSCRCRIGKTYALVPGIERGSKTVRLLSSRNIVPLPITFEEFAEELETKGGLSIKKPSQLDLVTLDLKYKNINICYKDYKEYSDHFKIMNQRNTMDTDSEAGLSERELVEKFLKGQTDSWEPYRKSWDFKRDAYLEIMEKVRHEMSKTRPEENDILLILGGGGLGKSVMLKRLAYDFYLEKTPVIILNISQTYFDLKLINKFCNEINDGLDLVEEKHKLIIVVDNADLNIDTLKNIRIFLKNNSKSALIIGAARINEWEYSVRQWGSIKVVPDANIIEIPQKMEQHEIRRLIEHIAQLLKRDELINDIDYWISRSVEDYESDFFAIIYGLVDPARRKLNEILWDEYIRLPSDTTKRAYEYVCLFYKYGIPLKLELIVNAIARKFDYSYNQFDHDILNSEAKSIIICIEDEIREEIFFRAKNKIIAEKIVERLFDIYDKDLLQKMIERYIEVLSEIKALDLSGIEIAKTLLIRYLGPNGFERGKIGGKYLAKLYDSVLNNGIDDCRLLHHYGILESREGDFKKAEKLLISSLEIAKQRYGGGDSEEEGKIMNSLGVLYSENAIKCLSSDEETAANLFEKAEHYFEISKKKNARSPHPYHAIAYSAFKRGEHFEAKGQDEEKYKWYSRALEMIGEAKESLSDDEMELILELESDIYTHHFNNFKKAEASLLEFMKKYPRNLSAYVIITKLIYNKAKKSPLGSDDYKDSCQETLDYIDGGLKISSRNRDLLKTKYRITKAIDPDDKENLHKLLLEIYLSADGNCTELNLLFDLAVLSFELGKFNLSKDVFRELDAKSHGHYKISGIVDFAKNFDGSKKVFSGYISELTPPKRGYVRPQEIPFPVKFSILTQQRDFRMKQEVRFNIAFNFRGVFAVDLRPK